MFCIQHLLQNCKVPYCRHYWYFIYNCWMLITINCWPMKTFYFLLSLHLKRVEFAHEMWNSWTFKKSSPSKNCNLFFVALMLTQCGSLASPGQCVPVPPRDSQEIVLDPWPTDMLEWGWLVAILQSQRNKILLKEYI